MADEHFLRGVFMPAPPPPTEVQQRLGKAVAALTSINQFMPVVLNGTNETAITMLREIERLTLQATYEFAQARHLVESGKRILPPEVEAPRG